MEVAGILFSKRLGLHQTEYVVAAFQAQEAETRRAGRRDGRGHTRPSLPVAPGQVAFGGVGVKPGVFWSCSALSAAFVAVLEIAQ